MQGIKYERQKLQHNLNILTPPLHLTLIFTTTDPDFMFLHIIYTYTKNYMHCKGSPHEFEGIVYKGIRRNDLSLFCKMH